METQTGDGKMIGSHAAKHAAEEGRKARKAGKESWDNPYSFMHETLQAYAWEEGWKRG
jgi:hypothetical protein